MARRRQTLAAHLAPFATKPKPAPVHHRTWIAEGLLRRGEITLLVGHPKEGKTCLAATLATAVARGEPFAGTPTEKTNVLYLAAEESPDEWSHALRPYLSTVSRNRLAVFFVSFAIDHQPTLDALARKIEANAVGLLVVDPLLAALDANDLSGFPAARSALIGLKSLCQRTNAAALVVHHPQASHPVLTARHRTFVLGHQQEGDARLVTLRGPDRTLRLVSRNPAHYAPASTTSMQKSPKTGGK